MGRTRLLVPQVWRWACCAEAAHHGVDLPCLQRNFFPDRRWPERGPDRGTRKGTCECAALFTANTCISGCLRHQEGQRKYNWAGHTSVPVHAMKSLCEQDGRLYAHINFFIPRTSKRAASGPVPRSSHSQLKIHFTLQGWIRNAANLAPIGALNMAAGKG